MPSLSEILQDPNYVNANEATKQAIFDKYSALDENFTNANAATQDAIRQKFGVPITQRQPTIDVLGQQFTPEEYQKLAKETGSSLQLPTELLKEGEKAKGAFSGMFGRSLYDYAADMALAWGKATGNTEQAEKEAKRLREYGEKTYTPSEKTFKEDPLEKILELAGGSAPYMLGPIAAGILAPEGSIGIAAATFPRLAGIAASTPAFTGSNLQRQMEADNIKLADTNLLSAGATAVGQSVLDQVGFSFIPGIKNIFTKAGMEIADEAAEALVKKSILARAGELALKTGEGMGIEGGTEAAQQLLERLQAGLSITDKDARKEYFESFVGGAVLGGALGVPGHLVETLFPDEVQKPEDLTQAEQPPAPPGAPPPPPTTPPTTGAISDTEIDEADLPGGKPSPPPSAEPVIKSKKEADAAEAAAKALEEEQRIKATKELMKKTYEAKPIEDKAVESEARSIQAEIENYNPAFASGMKNAVDQGRIQTTEDLDFYRRRLAEYKAQAGAGKSPIKETYNSMTFFQDDPAILKLREQALENAPQSIKDKIAKADELLQKIADRINSEGYSINEPNAPQNIKNLQARASNIGADVSQVLKKSEQIQKGRKIASPEKLAQKEAMLDESIADASEVVKEAEPEVSMPKVTDAKEMVKALGGENAQELAAPGTRFDKAYNYTNKDGVEVTFREEGRIFDLVPGDESTQVGSDVHLDYIGSKDKNKGLASKELDKIIKMADANNLSLSLDVIKQDKDGLTNEQLKDWYQRKGFIFPRGKNTGYRPRPNEVLRGYPEKTIQVPLDKIKEVEDQLNSDNFSRSFSDEETFFEMFGDDKLKEGYQDVPTEAAMEGYDDIFYYDGTNRPIRVSNIHARYDQKANKIIVSKIGVEAKPIVEEKKPEVKPEAKPEVKTEVPETKAKAPEVREKFQDKFKDFVNEELRKDLMEAKGQDILDQMEDKNVSPQDVAKRFWEDTYFKMPAKVQAYFRKQLKAITGFEPGDVIGRNKAGKDVVAKDLIDVAKTLDLGNRASKLDGTDRGFVVLMVEAIRRFNQNKYAYDKDVRGLSDEQIQKNKAYMQDILKKAGIEQTAPIKTIAPTEAEKEQRSKFLEGDFRVPSDEKLRAVYDKEAKSFLESVVLKSSKKPLARTEINTENLENVSPYPIEKKASDKVITDFEDQRKTLETLINRKDVRYYLNGIYLNKEDDVAVSTDGHRIAIIKNPIFKGMPDMEGTSGILGKDEKDTSKDKWIDGKYPDYKRITPESHTENKASINAADLGDYARAVSTASKYTDQGKYPAFAIEIKGDKSYFNAKFISDMTDIFRKFGYKTFEMSLTGDRLGRIYATSPDGKVSQVVMPIDFKKDIYKPYEATKPVEKAKGARPDGQTIDSIKDRIVREFGRSVQSLIKDGLIVVVNTVNELDPKYQNELDNQDKAFFDKDTGVAYIIADRVSAGDVRKVVLHEVGEHYGLRGMLGEKVYNEQLENLKKQKNRDITVAKAWDYVLKNYTNLLETDEKQFLREVMAKIGEDAPNHGLWKRFVTAIKAFLVKKGIIKNLTGTELQDLVMRSLHTTIKGRRVVSSGTGLESARGPTDPDAKRELDDELRANDIPDAPFNNQKDLTDKFKDNFGVVKGAIKGAAGAPKPTAIKMISGLDSKLTDLRIKTVFFGAGLEEKEAKEYAGKLVNSQGKAVASVALTNAVHAGHVAANVMSLGKLVFNQTTQMFQAVKDAFSMDNVFKAERSLFKKLGKQTATNLMNTFFEAKRARSIQNEFLNREAELQRAIDDGEDIEVAERNYESILKAYKKIPDYFIRKDANGDLMFTPVIENGEVVDQLPILNDDVIDDYIKKDKDFPELRDMMDNWTSVNHNMIDNMVFAGIISKKRGDHLKSIKDYVPWFRIQDDAEELHAPSTFVAGLTNISKEKTFKRGATTLRIDNIVDNMVHNVMMMTRNSIRNYGALQIAKAYATRKPNGKLAVFPKEGVMPDGAVRTNILVNGKRIIIEIKDPQIAASLLGLENLELPMLDGFSHLSQTLRRGVTTNPFFQAYQVFKDAPTAAAVTGLKSPYKIWAKILGSFFSALNPNDEIVKTLKSYGIGGFHSSARTAEKQVELTKGQRLMNIGPWILGILDHIGDASDYAQRRIIYQETIKQGGTEMEAIFRANAVIDFMRHGNSKAALALVRTVSFMNAYGQQIDVLATSMAGGGFKGMERKKARALFIKTTFALMASTLIYCMLKGGDDDYEDLDDQTKMRNYIIGDMKIPMGTSYSFFFKSMVEMAYSKIMNEGTAYAIDNTRLRRALSRAAYDSLLGPNPIATGAKPFIEVALNHNFFTGGTVVPRGLENMESFRQYTATTSNLGKVISALTFGALNPIQADHIIRGLFGTAGALAMWGSDLFTDDKPEKTWAQNPIVGQMFLPPEPRGREDQFYDLKQRSDEAYNTWMNMVKNQRTLEAKEYLAENKDIIKIHDYITSAEAGLKEKNAQIRMIADTPKINPEEKRRRITKLQEQKNDIIKNINYFRHKAGQ